MLKGRAVYVVSGSKRVINIPSLVHSDSQFPFRKGDRLEIEIRDNLLIIKREQTAPEA